MKTSEVVHSFIKGLSRYGYICSKSQRSPGRSYYFKKQHSVTIRLSDHYLHPNQVRSGVVEVILINDDVYVNEKELIIEVKKAKYIYKIAKERILLECQLYGKPMPKSRRKLKFFKNAKPKE